MAPRHALPLSLLLSVGALLDGAAAAQETPPQATAEPIVLANGVLEIAFRADGGTPLRWEVLGGAGTAAVALLDPEYVARSRQRPLALALGRAPDFGHWEVRRAEEGDDQVVRFRAPAGPSGLEVVKTYALARGSYVLRLQVDLLNKSEAPLELGAGGVGPGLGAGPGLGYAAGRRPRALDEALGAPPVLPFVAGADGVTSLDVPAPGEEPLVYAEAPITWGGVHSSYFVLALVPRAPFAQVRVDVDAGPALAEIASAAERVAYPYATFFHAPVSIAPGSSASFTYSIYAGPKDRALMRAAQPGLETVLYHHLPGWLAALCRGLEGVLSALYAVLHSWGLAILVFAVLFRVFLLPLSVYGARSQMRIKAKMAELKPRIAAIKREHAGDGDARNEAILALYKEHGVNPFAHLKGCLPLLIQLPILIALFQLMLGWFALRGASFLWIDDLTLPDRLFPLGVELPWLGSSFNLLPVLMLVAMVVVGRSMAAANPVSPPPAAAIYALPVVLTVLLYPFPAGCMLFWTTGNLLQVPEQKVVARTAR